MLLLNLLLTLACILIFPLCRDDNPITKFLTKNFIGNVFLKITKATDLLSSQLTLLLTTLLISIIIQTLTFFSIYILSKALTLPAQPEIRHIFIATPFASLANAMPLPGGGLGAGEIVFAEVLQKCQTSAGVYITGGAAVLLFWRFFSILLAVLLGFPTYLTYQKTKFNELEPLQLNPE